MAVSIRSAKLPIVAQLLDYRHDWLKLDLAAGLSVAALSLPSAIAYPAIAGLPTEVGFFATILALAAYAMFGPSRQLIVGPDAATCKRSTAGRLRAAHPYTPPQPASR